MSISNRTTKKSSEKSFKICTETSLSECLSIQLKIKDFFAFKPKSNSYFESSSFVFLNESMYLIIFPYGNYIHGKDWIVLDIIRPDPTNTQTVLFKKAGIKTIDGRVYKLMERGKDHENASHSLLVKLMKYSKLLADQDVFDPSGEVIFFYEISYENGDSYSFERTNNDITVTSSASQTETCNTVDFLETLSTDLEKFYSSKNGSDCVLKTADIQFSVHRLVLSIRSEVFAAMFSHDTTENRSGIVDIPDIESSILGHVLFYIYTGKIREVTEETAARMYTAADKYGLLELRRACLKFLLSHLAMENFCDAAIVAHTHGEILLNKAITDFIDENLEEVTENDKWQTFSKKNSILANKLLTAAYLKRVRQAKLARK